MAVWLRSRSDVSKVLRRIVENQKALGVHLDDYERPGWGVRGAAVSPDFAKTALNVWVEDNRYLGIVVGVKPAPLMELNLDDRRRTETALIDIDGDILLLHTGKFTAISAGGVLRPVWEDTIQVGKRTWFKISSVNDDDFFRNVFRYYLSRRPNGEPTDEDIEGIIDRDATLSPTERQELRWARNGQGQYRKNLQKIEKRCRVTGVSDRRLLRASHMKPWALCETYREQLDGYNGLLLAPHIDHLFDQGYISFENEGSMLVSLIIDPDQLHRLGITTSPPLHVGPFHARQRPYLDYHRTHIFDVRKSGRLHTRSS